MAINCNEERQPLVEEQTERDRGYGAVGGQGNTRITSDPSVNMTSESWFRHYRHQNRIDVDEFSGVVFPSFWQPMKAKTVVGVLLDPRSKEAREVCKLFFENISRNSPPYLTIQRILRIQNPRLWAHYYRKRQQMRRANSGRPVVEYRLFHGTRADKVDSICRKGFEVGRAGSSAGCYFGRGIYFTQDTIWAHVYTKCGTTEDYPKIFTSPLSTFASMDTREFSDINYRHGWRRAHPLIDSLECSSTEGEDMHFSNGSEEDDDGAGLSVDDDVYVNVGEEEDTGTASEQAGTASRTDGTSSRQQPVLTERIVRPLVPERPQKKTDKASTSSAAKLNSLLSMFSFRQKEVSRQSAASSETPQNAELSKVSVRQENAPSTSNTTQRNTVSSSGSTRTAEASRSGVRRDTMVSKGPERPAPSTSNEAQRDTVSSSGPTRRAETSRTGNALVIRGTVVSKGAARPKQAPKLPQPVRPGTELSGQPETQEQTTTFTSAGRTARDTVVSIPEARRATFPRATATTSTSTQRTKDGTCRHHMLLSSVLVGSTAPGQSYYIMPPRLNPSSSRRHDSCYGRKPTHLEFVVFRNNQAYPEYLIEYRHSESAPSVPVLHVLLILILVNAIIIFFIVEKISGKI